MQLCSRLPSPMGESAVDCGGLSSMPNVSFTIGGRVFDLSPEQVWCNLLIVLGLSVTNPMYFEVFMLCLCRWFSSIFSLIV